MITKCCWVKGVVVSIVVILFILTLNFKALSQEASLATEFVYPVLGSDTTEPKNNIIDPRVSSANCESGKWYTNANDFGNNYCPDSLGCEGPDCYHPGEDWNLCPAGTNEGGTNVYSIANGTVVRKTTVFASGSTESGYYITLEHKLPKAENISDYIYQGTTADGTFDTVYSTYMHIDNSMLNVGDIVEKGDVVGVISECCSHLHFEMKTYGTGAANCGSCGYCTSYQHLTDSYFIEPDKFISAYTNASSNSSKCKLFPDIYPSFWYFKYVYKLACEGIISGYPDGKYRPADPVNRVEFLKMVVEATGNKCTSELCESEPPFIDARNPADWFYPYVKFAYNKGWIGCESDSSDPNMLCYLDPDAGIPRGEVAEILVKALGKQDAETSSVSPFADMSSGSTYYIYAFIAKGLQIFGGYPEGKDCKGNAEPGIHFCPSYTINRAEAAKVIVEAFFD